MSATHVAREHTYRGRAVWTGAAHGPTARYDAYSRDYTFEIVGKPLLSGSADVPFRGDAAKHNPEDLLLAALSACHLLSYLAECARAGILVSAYEDDATGTMGFVDGRLRFTGVLLHPRVVIAAGDPARAAALHERAHAQCFIAASVNFPVRHEATIEAAH